MRVTVEYQNKDCWKWAYKAALATEGKIRSIDDVKEPSGRWKYKLTKALHSPIRLVTYWIQMMDVPYWVIGHLVRHHQGVEKFVSSQRSDRTGIPRDDLPQNNPVNTGFALNAQAMINISKKRLCRLASPETQAVWGYVIAELGQIDPIVAHFCRAECVVCGTCNEMKPCGYYKTEKFAKEREYYLDPKNFEFLDTTKE